MKIYSTLSGQKEEFQPQGDVLRMYVCGVTPYDECHIGHALSYIYFDAVRRYLEFRGYKVKHVQNFTDIDDKIILRARNLGISPQELAERYIQRYFEDMDALNIRRAHIYPRATQEIDEIIRLVAALIEKGHAYQAGGDVYFRVRSFANYGQLSKRTLEGMMAGARVEVEEDKEHPMDFALWKHSHPEEPSWPSPWGPGRPGWHIECSAMSLKYLGNRLDIHGGGQDLIFPHHENETAQSEAYTGEGPFSRFWMHNGLLRLGQEKMSKSLGNLITIRQALEGNSADGLRVLVLGSHYRSPLTYSPEAQESAERAAERLRQVVWGARAGSGAPLDPAPYRERFIEAMDDDFNTAQALATLFDLGRDINRAGEEKRDTSAAQTTFQELARGVLGLTLEARRGTLNEEPFMTVLLEAQGYLREAGVPEEKVVAPHGSLGDQSAFPPTGADLLIGQVIAIRRELRQMKRWALADKLRSSLADLGVALEDTANGTIWKRRSGASVAESSPEMRSKDA